MAMLGVLLAVAGLALVGQAAADLLPLPTLAPPVNPAEHNLSTPQLAVRDGYPVESYYVTSEDNYILNVFRIPSSPKLSGSSGSSKPVVFLQHGVISSSACWQTNKPDSRLAYILADAGYDVWLGNSRGNIYSRNHTTKNPDTDPSFWQFTYHQSGVYDLPAIIDFILAKTGRPTLSYVGHSMGTTMFWVLLSEKPEYNSKVNGMIALAPVGNTTYLTSPIRLIAPTLLLNLTSQIVANLSTSGTGEYSPNGSTQQLWKTYTCATEVLYYTYCSLPNFVIYGFDYAQLNKNISADLSGHYPQGTSVYSIIHLAQGINTAKFQQFDYGSVAANQQAYGSNVPPLYNLNNVRTNVTFLWGQNDWLADPKDVDDLKVAITGTKVNSIRVNNSAWNHADFVSALEANLYVNQPVLSILSQYNN